MSTKSNLKLEIMIRLVDGSQLYWDASERLELTEEEAAALRPRRMDSEPPSLDQVRPFLDVLGVRYIETTTVLWKRILGRFKMR